MSDEPMGDRERIADALGAMPEAYNVTDPSDEQETWINAPVEAVADAVLAALPSLADRACAVPCDSDCNQRCHGAHLPEHKRQGATTDVPMGDRERIAQALGGHRLATGPDGIPGDGTVAWIHCICGYREVVPTPDDDIRVAEVVWDAHLADAVSAAIPAPAEYAKAALLDAADDAYWYDDSGQTNPHAEWLRARANDAVLAVLPSSLADQVRALADDETVRLAVAEAINPYLPSESPAVKRMTNSQAGRAVRAFADALTERTNRG